MNKENIIIVTIPEELLAYAKSQTGEGSKHHSISEYLTYLIGQDQERELAENISESILEGYKDVVEGRVKLFSGNLKKDIDLSQ